MRVLHLGKFFYPSHGGIETFLMDLAEAANGQGVENGLLVHTEHQAQNTGTKDLVSFPFLKYFDRVPSWGSLGYAPISPGFPRALDQALKTFKPDLLHLHMPNPSAFWALVSRKARSLPWIVHWHADARDPAFAPIVRALYPIYFPFEQALLKRADAVVVSSPPYLEGSSALSRWRDKCQVVPLGLKPHRLQGRNERISKESWDDSDQLRVLALGRLASYKGFDRLIEAAAQTKAKVVIAGSGENIERLTGVVNDLQLDEHVSLLGGVTDEQRNALLASCDLVCLPSLNRAEAFGISVLEGMAVGKPALVSRIEGSGLPWLVIDQKTGWHVPPGNVERLAKQINDLDQNRQLLKTAGQKARQRFEQNFHIDAVARQISALQEEMVNKR